jgi:hypothetical protein
MSILSNTSPETGSSENGSIDLLIFGGTEPYVIVFDEDTIPSTSISGLSSGEYTITVFDQNGCSENISVFVDQILSTGVHNGDQRPLIFPNPTDGLLHLQYSNSIQEISVHNTKGTKVKALNPEKTLFDLSELESGIYILQVIDQHSRSKLIKFIKE